MEIPVVFWKFIVAQIIAVVALAFLVVSFQLDRKEKILSVIGVFNFFYAISLIFLEAYAGAVICGLAVIRSFFFAYKGRKDNSMNIWHLLLFEFLTFVFAFLFWEGELSVILLAGNMVVVFVCWQENEQVLRYGSIFLSCCFIFYNIMNFAYISVISESIAITSCIIGIVRFRKINKKNGLALSHKT